LPIVQSSQLRLVNNRHSKEYDVTLESQGGGYVVNFAYGAIGAPLKAGTKTPQPVGLAEAQKVYHKLIAEKSSKPCSCCGGSYTPSGTPPTPPEPSVAVCALRREPDRTPENSPTHPGFNPELLEPVDVQAAGRLISSGQYGVMRKYDGHRHAYSKRGSSIVGYNRLGKQIPVAAHLAEELRRFDASTVFVDGEYIAGRFVAFDLLEIDGHDIRQMAFQARHEILADKFADTTIVVAPLWVGLDNCMAAIQEEMTHRGEGVVLKHLRRGYMPGRQGTNLKMKFWRSATVRIAKKQKTTMHHSFGMEVFAKGVRGMPDRWMYCGSCTCKGSLPELGTYREVKYLYVAVGGHLYQPEDWGAREDVTDADCLWTSLVPKQDSERLI